MVKVINIDGKPLMPTKRHRKVRHLLKEGKAKVVRYYPFTIQLLYKSKNYTQYRTPGSSGRGQEKRPAGDLRDRSFGKEDTGTGVVSV